MINIPLLPWQIEFASDIDTYELGMLGGLNSGKTYVFCVKAIILAAVNCDGPQTVTRGGLLEPTNNLVRTHLIPNMFTILERMGIDYDWHGSDQIIDLKFENGNFPILLTSAENHERLVAHNWAFVGFEELDTSTFELAAAAYAKGKERVRWGKHRQVFTTSTIEGNKFLHHNFVENASTRKRTIHANTEDNPLVDRQYLEDLRESMAPQEYAVRVQGKWGSILSKRVYPDYEDIPSPNGNLSHLTSADLPLGMAIHVGMDFNTGKCHSAIHMMHQDGAVAIDEYSGAKNSDSITYLKTTYPNRPIIVYPDTSGDNQGYIGYDTAISELRSAGFIVKLNSRKQSSGSDSLMKGSNPYVGDRIAAVNAMILNSNGKRRYLVNKEKCPMLHRSLSNQQWVKKGDTEIADKSRDIDHPLDAAGYFVFFNWPIRKGPTARTM